MEQPGDERVPFEADVSLPESSGPAVILEAMRQR